MRAFLVCFLLSSTLAWAQSKVAVVKMLRGEATVTAEGKASKLAQDAWIPSGAIVKTAEKSFVRLVFIDKSQMNIGPNSEMKIEQFGGGDSGVIDLVKGKIRSQVSKDYLQQKDKDKSKLFIKTPNAVMGVRGTDFLISTNGVNSSTVLFEGEVLFNKYEEGRIPSANDVTDRLEAVVDRGVRMMPGEFSVVEANRPNPTVPSLLNVQQVETLEKNQEFTEAANGETARAGKSVVPNGLSGAVVANTSSELSKELEQSGVVPAAGDSPAKVDAETAKGFVSDTSVKPTNGSLLHVDSGVVIAPPKDAVFDANTGTFIPPASTGAVANDGSFVPPSGMAITEKGEVLAKVGNEIVKLDKLSPVSGEGATFGDAAAVVVKIQAPPVGSAPATGSAPGGATSTAPKLDSKSAAVLMESTSQTTNIVVTGPKGEPQSVFPGQQPGGTLLDGKATIEAPTLCATCAFKPGASDLIKESTRVNIGTGVADP